MGELVALQKLVYERCGDEFLSSVVGELQQLGHAADVVQQYVLHLQTADVATLKNFARGLAEKRRKALLAAAQ